MALTQTQVSEFYVAIFGRPSEQGGSQYWSSLPYDTTTIADGMLTDALAIEYFGDSLNSNRAFIEHIYLNTFGRTYEEDPTGIDFWVSKLDEGFSRGFIVNELIAAIKREPDESPALQQFLNRVEISNYYAERVDGGFPEFNFGPNGLDITNDPNSVSDAKNKIDEKEEVINTPDPKAKLTLDANITADDIINIAESESTVFITGTVGRDVEEGDEVTLEVNGTLYFGEVQDDDTFSIEVLGSDLIEDSRVKASVTATENGKSDTDKDSESYELDLIAPTASFQSIPAAPVPGKVIKLEAAGNTDEDDTQPQIAAIDDNGNFVVAWFAENEFGDLRTFVQNFDPAGQALGGSLELNAEVSPDGNNKPFIAGLGDGAYAITWYGNDSNSDDSIFVFHFDPNDILHDVTPTTIEPADKLDGSDSHPNITAVGSNGAFVVTWQGTDVDGDPSVYLQQFNADGSLNGGQFKFEHPINESDREPQVVSLGDDGEFILSWHGEHDAGGSYAVFIQKFNADGTVSGDSVMLDAPGTSDHADVIITPVGTEGAFVVSWEGDDAEENFSTFTVHFPADFDFTASQEFQVNTHTANAQVDSATTALKDGGFVVTWQSYDQDGDEGGIYGQRYDETGSPVGNEFQINTEASEEQRLPSISSLEDGGFVVIWDSANQESIDSYGVFGQRYDANGNTVGNEFQVNNETNENQFSAAVAGLADGGFVVTWQSDEQDGDDYGIYAQRYDASGNTVAGEFQVNTETTSHQDSPAITALDDGGFVITWQSFLQDTFSYGIYGQRYDVNGNTVGGEFQVNTTTADTQYEPKITSLLDGGFVITWTSSNQDGHVSGVYAQRYDNAGATVGGEFLVNTTTAADQKAPAIAALKDGGFIITWESRAQDGGTSSTYGIFGQRYDDDGNTVGDEFQVNTTFDGNQIDSSLAVLEDGDFVVTWSSDDTSNFGIFGQRFDANANPVYLDLKPSIVDIGGTGTSDRQIAALGNDGAYAIVWSQFEAGFGTDSSIYVQKYNADGSLDGAAIKLEPPAIEDGVDQRPQITAVGDDGAFIVTWQAQVNAPGDEFRIYVQEFDADGNAIGDPEPIETNEPTFKDLWPQITALDNEGGYGITWMGEDDPDEDYSVYVQASSAKLNLTVHDDFVVRSSEIGMAYIVHEDVVVTSVADIVAADNDKWNAVNITTANADTNLPAEGLTAGSYYLYAVDEAGNLSAPAEEKVNVVVDSSIVVFDLINGESSSHSGRYFNADTAYTIYILVDSDSHELEDPEPWTGAGNLGTDDTIVLVGSGSPVTQHITYSYYSSVLTYSFESKVTSYSQLVGPHPFSSKAFGHKWGTTDRATGAATLTKSGTFYRNIFTSSYSSYLTATPNGSTTTIDSSSDTLSDSVRLWTVDWWNPLAAPNNGKTFSQVYLQTMPNGIMTSQGLTPVTTTKFLP
jgi:hypothetical protein